MAKTKVKLLILGDAGVGKTSLLFRYTDDCFSDDASQALGEDFRRKELVVDGHSVVLELWDTGGQERFRTITSSFYRGAHAVLLAYDITAKESVEKLPVWLQEVKQFIDEASVAVAIVGCKCDLQAERQVAQQELEATYSAQKLPVFETSAKTAVNIDAPFLHVVKKAVKQLQAANDTPTEVPLIIGGASLANANKAPSKKKDSGCQLV